MSSAWRKLLFIAAISAICAGCAHYGLEVPGTRYVVTRLGSGSPAACEDLAEMFENQADLKRMPRAWPLPSGEYCEVFWSRTGTHNFDASAAWDENSLRIWVPYHVHAFRHFPSEDETRLENQLVDIVKGRYPTAKVESEKAYCLFACP